MTQPVPGWYPDPTGKPGQMYWDGQRWVPPAGPPQNPVPASLRRRWSALRTRTKMAIVAALAVCVAAWISMMGGGGTSGTPAGGAPSAPSGQSAPSAPSPPPGKSDSYKAGYAIGLAPAGSGWGGGWAVHNRFTCGQAYERVYEDQVHPYNEDDYVEGCMQAIQDRIGPGSAP